MRAARVVSGGLFLSRRRRRIGKITYGQEAWKGGGASREPGLLR
jgi:hypothetical protein